jgi:hypothetical protein
MPLTLVPVTAVRLDREYGHSGRGIGHRPGSVADHVEAVDHRRVDQVLLVEQLAGADEEISVDAVVLVDLDTHAGRYRLRLVAGILERRDLFRSPLVGIGVRKVEAPHVALDVAAVRLQRVRVLPARGERADGREVGRVRVGAGVVGQRNLLQQLSGAGRRLRVEDVQEALAARIVEARRDQHTQPYA